jgi:hypothetical protein
MYAYVQKPVFNDSCVAPNSAHHAVLKVSLGGAILAVLHPRVGRI